MKQRHHLESGPDLPAEQFRPDRVRLLLCCLKRELEQFQGRDIPYDELGRYAGQAGSTVFEKLLKSQHPQVEALLGWLEHLPADRYCRLLADACRCLPTLSHSRLAHDPVQVSSLKNLLQQEAGRHQGAGQVWQVAADHLGFPALRRGQCPRRLLISGLR